MKHCHLLLLFTIFLFLTTTSHAIRTKFSSSSSSSTLLHPWPNSPITRGTEFQFQKRTVPTGSNPLHNKR
ncbi:hypothetical protein LR48_Vigan272s006500 [Vigna angularis]|uniref:Uncharacterized protein n=2 Tax=Phaseolus angularis TaxID=3914 RepID=A0A0L9T7C5_PHAAN|nr:hypothetical protein LR48_Vigan272s006500 [Vigna angularis]BAT88917.1 hypothetical protein VIGAN_05256400 [Vigna angularis var. angularis]